MLRASGVRVLVDHFGVRDIAVGTRHPGFQAVLALGREGIATVKLSSPFPRLDACWQGFDDLDPYVDELLKAFGVEGCLWGSDWPFINVPQASALCGRAGALVAVAAGSRRPGARAGAQSAPALRFWRLTDDDAVPETEAVEGRAGRRRNDQLVSPCRLAQPG